MGCATGAVGGSRSGVCGFSSTGLLASKFGRVTCSRNRSFLPNRVLGISLGEGFLNSSLCVRRLGKCGVFWSFGRFCRITAILTLQAAVEDTSGCMDATFAVRDCFMSAALAAIATPKSSAEICPACGAPSATASRVWRFVNARGETNWLQCHSCHSYFMDRDYQLATEVEHTRTMTWGHTAPVSYTHSNCPRIKRCKSRWWP